MERGGTLPIVSGSPADHSGLQPQYIYKLRTGGPLVRSVLLPLVSKIGTAAFNRALFPDGEYELDLDMSGFDRGDPATRWNNHHSGNQRHSYR